MVLVYAAVVNWTPGIDFWAAESLPARVLINWGETGEEKIQRGQSLRTQTLQIKTQFIDTDVQTLVFVPSHFSSYMHLHVCITPAFYLLMLLPKFQCDHFSSYLMIQ